MTPAESPSCCRSDARDAADLAEDLFITVIMPVRNEAKFIERTFTQLVAQNYDPERFEIIVVDGQSTDGTPERVAKFVEQHRNVRLLRESAAFGQRSPQRRPPPCPGRRGGDRRRPLRVGGRPVSGQTGVGLRSQRRRLHRPAAAAGHSRPPPPCNGRSPPPAPPGWGITPIPTSIRPQEGFVPAKSVAVAYRRSVFEQVGTFDERFDACEDVEINHRIDRAGLRCFFTPEAAVHYAPRDSLSRPVPPVGPLRPRPRAAAGESTRRRFRCGILPSVAVRAGDA